VAVYLKHELEVMRIRKLSQSVFISHMIMDTETKKYYLESRSREIFCMKYVNGRRTGLVTFCVETAFYKRILKER
jgi:hypothetical protein